MANRYWVGGTGNWNDTGHWSTASGGSSGASVPGTSDDAFFDGSSGTGTATVNVAATPKSVDFTGYEGGFTLGANITTQGSFVLVSGMTFTPSTYAVTINNTGTLTSGGKAFYDLSMSANGKGAVTFTLGDDVTVNNTLTFQGGNGSTVTLTGNTYYAKGNVTFGSNADTFSGTSNLICNGTGNQTLTGYASSFVKFNIDVQSGGGTFYFAGTLRFGGGKTLDISSGTIDTTTNTAKLQFDAQAGNGTYTDAVGVTWYDVAFRAYGAYTVTLNNDITCSHALTFTGNNGTTMTINGSDIIAQGTISDSTSTDIISGTSDLIINGGANQTWTGGNALTYAFASITINKSGNTLTLSGTIKTKTAVWTYTAGTVDAGTSKIIIVGACTINTSGMSFYDFSLYGSGYTVTLSSVCNVSNNLDFYFANVVGVTVNGYKFMLGGNLTWSDVNTYRNISSASSTTVIEFTGSGTHTISGGNSIANAPECGLAIIFNTTGATTMSNYFRLNNDVTFTAGDVTFPTFIWFGGITTRTISYGSGTLDENGCNFRFGGSNSLSAYTLSASFLGALGTISGEISFYSTGTVTLQDDWGTTGNVDFMLANTTGITLNGYSLTVGGSLLFSDSSTYPNSPSGTTDIILNGTGNIDGTNAGFGLDLTINTEGTITFNNETFKFGKVGFSPTFSIVAGTISAGTSLFQTINSCNLNFGTAVLYDLQVSTAGTATMTGNATIAHSCTVDASRNLTIGANTLTLQGNLVNNGSITATGSTVVFDGTSTVSGNNITFNNLTINSAKTLHLTSGKTYVVNGAFTANGSVGNSIVLDATSGGSRATLTLNGTISAKYITATDIDSSSGGAVHNGHGTNSNTVNWDTFDYVTTLSDSASLTDQTISYARGYSRTLSDGISESDSIAARDIIRKLSDQTSVSDAILKLSSKGFIEQTTLEDLIAVGYLCYRILTDSVGLQEEVNRSCGKTLSDVLSANDDFNRFLSRVLSDSCGVSDAKSFGRYLSLFDGLSASDALAKLKGLVLTELLSATENFDLDKFLVAIAEKSRGERTISFSSKASRTINEDSDI